MSSNNIPTDEDFARARAKLKENDRGLSEVRSEVLNRFRESGLHEIFVFYSPANNLFVAHIFYQRNDQIGSAEESGLSSQIKEAVFEALEQVGRGNRNTLRLEFTFDSHENVEDNYEGDYYSRLR